MKEFAVRHRLLSFLLVSLALVSLAGTVSGCGDKLPGTGPSTNAMTIVSFAVDVSTAKVGSVVTLRWETLNAVSAYITVTAGPNIGSVNLSGSRTVPVTTAGTTTYSLTVTDRNGRTATGFASVIVTP